MYLTLSCRNMMCSSNMAADFCDSGFAAGSGDGGNS